MLACSCGSTNAMQVSLWLGWETEIDDSFNIGNVEASGDDICCYKIVNLTVLKGLNRKEPIRLIHISMDLCSLEAIHRHQSH